MPDEKQDPNLARVRDLEQALECHKHLLGKTRTERDELQRAVDAALVDHSALESERARLTREVEQLRADLLRVTEERNAAREARRAMEFELQLLRDGPSRSAGSASEEAAQ